MISFGLNKKQFAGRYRRCLDRLSDGAIRQFQELFARQVPPTVRSAEVQLFLDADNYGTPNAWIYFSGENNKIDNSDQSIFPGRSLELEIGLNELEECDERYFSDEDFGGLDTMADVLQTWFAECWWKAGGWTYLVPTKVQVHDGFGDVQDIRLTRES